MDSSRYFLEGETSCLLRSGSFIGLFYENDLSEGSFPNSRCCYFGCRIWSLTFCRWSISRNIFTSSLGWRSTVFLIGILGTLRLISFLYYPSFGCYSDLLRVLLVLVCLPARVELRRSLSTSFLIASRRRERRRCLTSLGVWSARYEWVKLPSCPYCLRFARSRSSIRRLRLANADSWVMNKEGSDRADGNTDYYTEVSRLDFFLGIPDLSKDFVCNYSTGSFVSLFDSASTGWVCSFAGSFIIFVCAFYSSSSSLSSSSSRTSYISIWLAPLTAKSSIYLINFFAFWDYTRVYE